MIKTNKSKFFGPLTVLGLVFSFITFIPLPVKAVVGNLSVEFENSPLFSESNFLPGSAVTRFVKVTNNTDSVQNVFTKTTDEINYDNFGDVLELVVKRDSDILWSGTLTDFFITDKTPLSLIAAQQTIQYDYTISMASGADNNSQGKTLGFNLVIGFGNTNDEVDDSNGTITISGTNGSGGGSVTELIIFNERDLNVSEGTADITWQTNHLSTSRIIYSAESEPHDFNYLNPPNYGYAHSTVEDPSLVTFHQMNLTGLMPGTLYYYRVISHASPDTVSLSYIFTTSDSKPEVLTETAETGEGQLSAPNQGQGQGAVLGLSSEVNQGEGSGDVSEENQPETLLENNQENNGQVAGEQEICNSWPWWLIIIMLLDYLILMALNYLDKSNKELTNLKKRLSFVFALLLIALPILVYFFSVSFVWWSWLIVIVAYAIVLIAYAYDLRSNNYWRLNIIITLYLLLMIALLKMFSC